MGRPRKNLDQETVLDLVEQGLPRKTIAEELGVSLPTLAKTIGEISKKEGIILQYRAIQSLQLTEIQAKVLDSISDEKINDAPLRDLVYAFKILKDKEQVMDGKPSDIKGLVSYLIEVEKKEFDEKNLKKEEREEPKNEKECSFAEIFKE